MSDISDTSCILRSCCESL